MVDFHSDAVDATVLLCIVAAQRLVSALAGSVSPDMRRLLWSELEGLLTIDTSDDVAAEIAFGLRQLYDIPQSVLKKLSSKADRATAILFEQGEGISDADWSALSAAAPHGIASALAYRQRTALRKAQDQARTLETINSSTVLGAGYPTLKSALRELYQQDRLTNNLLAEVVSIWGLPSIIGTLALRSGLSEDQVLQAMRGHDTRAALFSSCNFDAALTAHIRAASKAERKIRFA